MTIFHKKRTRLGTNTTNMLLGISQFSQHVEQQRRTLWAYFPLCVSRARQEQEESRKHLHIPVTFFSLHRRFLLFHQYGRNLCNDGYEFKPSFTCHLPPHIKPGLRNVWETRHTPRYAPKASGCQCKLLNYSRLRRGCLSSSASVAFPPPSTCSS